MINLKAMQTSFQQYLLDSEDNKIISHISSTVELPAIKRLSIYGDAYESRLLEALASNFPFLKSCMGEDEFARLGTAYIKHHPSIYRSIRWYGDSFSKFILHDDIYKSFSYLYDIAELDWVMTLVFDAKDASILSLDAMAQILPDQWSEMRFLFHPSIHKRQFSWNVVEFWQSTLDERDRISLIKHANEISWIFWRKDLTSHFYSLTTEESRALAMAIDGLNFAEICEGLCDVMDVDIVALTAATMLKKWISSGLISKILF